MTTIAKGVNKQLIIAEQTALGTPAAVDAATAEYMRRVTSTVDKSKETYESNEKRTDMQVSDMRHGAISIGGALSGELSPGSYQMLIESVFRRDWTAGASDAANNDVTAASTGTGTGTFTRNDPDESGESSGEGFSWLDDGFKAGDVVRMTGWTTTATANNNHNFLITALTDTVMTVKSMDNVNIAAKAAGDPITTTVVGKKTFMPTSGHTNTYFTIEHYYSDIDKSEVFTDCKFSSMDIKLPPSGMSTIDFNVVGLGMAGYDTSEAPYFTGPTAMSEYGILAAVNGLLYVNGAAVALLTGLDISINPDTTVADPVVGSNSRPDVFDGKLRVSGNMTVYFTDTTFRGYFDNEDEISLYSVFTTSDDAAADFLAFTLPRIKVGGAGKDDNDKGIVQTIPFTALLNTSGGTGISSEETTMSIQDSTL
jgi:hypothetical protein